MHSKYSPRREDTPVPLDEHLMPGRHTDFYNAISIIHQLLCEDLRQMLEEFNVLLKTIAPKQAIPVTPVGAQFPKDTSQFTDIKSSILSEQMQQLGAQTSVNIEILDTILARKIFSDSVPKNISLQALATIERARPYMTPAQIAAIEEFIPQTKSKLTLDTIIGLVSLLLTIMSTLIAISPDPQTDTLIEQQGYLIQQVTVLVNELQETNERLENIEQFTIGGNHFSCEIADPANNGLNVSDPSTEPKNCEAVEDACQAQQ